MMGVLNRSGPNYRRLVMHALSYTVANAKIVLRSAVVHCVIWSALTYVHVPDSACLS